MSEFEQNESVLEPPKKLSATYYLYNCWLSRRQRQHYFKNLPIKISTLQAEKAEETVRAYGSCSRAFYLLVYHQFDPADLSLVIFADSTSITVNAKTITLRGNLQYLDVRVMERQHYPQVF